MTKNNDLLAPWAQQNDRVLAPGLYSGRGQPPVLLVFQDMLGHISPAEQAFLRRAVVNIPQMLRALDLTVQALKKAAHDSVAREVALLACEQAISGLEGK